jgi:hypothetical protein
MTIRAAASRDAPGAGIFKSDGRRPPRNQESAVITRYDLVPVKCGADGLMDWFEALTGFRETTYADTRAKLRIQGNQLRSLINGRSYCIGEFELGCGNAWRTSFVIPPVRRQNSGRCQVMFASCIATKSSSTRASTLIASTLRDGLRDFVHFTGGRMGSASGSLPKILPFFGVEKPALAANAASLTETHRATSVQAASYPLGHHGYF